jgi:cytochrome P450
MTTVEDLPRNAPHIDLLDPKSYLNGQPIDQMLYLQEHDPVHWHPDPEGGPGFWALTRFNDIKKVQGNPGLFSSFPTVTVPDGTSLGDGKNYCHLIMTDPPAHTVRRRHIAQELLPASVKDMTAHVDGIVTTILDEVCEAGECDLVNDIAGKLAAWVTADLMGVPRPDMVRMYEIADRIINTRDLTSGDGLEAAMELQAYSQAVWDDRRATPRGDMVSRYAHDVVGGKEPEYGQFALDFLLIFGAAGDTTRNVVGGGMAVLFDNPAEHDKLRRDPGLINSGVEEMLRWVTPIVYQRRTAQADTEIGGQQIKAGAKVANFFTAANRDPSVFPDPMRFDVERAPNNHMAFGFGPHFCLGSHLARLELRLMFRELMRRLPDLQPSAPIVWSRPDLEIAPIVVGPHSMPVRFTPSPRSDHAA